MFGQDGVLEGAHAGMAFFDLSTNSQAMVQADARRLRRQGLRGPRFAGQRRARGRPHRQAGHLGRRRPRRLRPAGTHPRSFGDQPAYIGPIGTATVAKLVHNLPGYAIQTVMAEAFSMGVKAGMDPLELWAAVRQGALGRKRTFDRLQDQYLQNSYDPPAFALRLGHKDVSLAAALGREVGVPMRLSNLVLEEMTEALNRGWGQRDSRSPMLLQNERAGVSFSVDPAAIRAVLAKDKP